jgi:hypothetical protein
VSFHTRDAPATRDASQRALGQHHSRSRSSSEVSKVQEKVLSSPRRNIGPTQQHGRQSRLGRAVTESGGHDIGHNLS